MRRRTEGAALKYASARPLRTFTLHGRTFTVVRWRDENGKHWRGYTALLHNGRCVAHDISRNATEAVETWEAMLARRYPTPARLEAALVAFGDKEAD